MSERDSRWLPGEIGADVEKYALDVDAAITALGGIKVVRFALRSEKLVDASIYAWRRRSIIPMKRWLQLKAFADANKIPFALESFLKRS